MVLPKIIKIIRIHIVLGGALAFTLGALLATANGGTIDPVRVALCYAVVFLGDLSTHYSNDYFDVEVDKYATQKKFFTGSTILVANPQLRSLSKSISVSLLATSSVLAAVLVSFYGLPIEFLVITLAANFLGWIYSAPPARLISRGLGEVTVAVATGFAIPGVGYLAVRGQFDPLFACFAVPFMMYGLILSLSLEAPDFEVDRKGGKRNLVVRKGEGKVFSAITALAVSATVAFCVYAWQIAPAILNLGVVALFSVVPLAAGALGLVSVLRKKSVDRFSTLNIASLFAFNVLMVSYLATIVLTA